MGYTLNVTADQWDELLVRSQEMPVLVDFYALWCGPCQLLKPTLEKLVQEYDFILAKVDIDQCEQLAAAQKVEGVPDVRIIHQGKVIPGFVGALPEAKIRELLRDLHLDSNLDRQFQSLSDRGAAAWPELLAFCQTHGDREDLVLTTIKLGIRWGQLDGAEALLKTFSPEDRALAAAAAGVRSLIYWVREVQQPDPSPLGQQYAQAARQALEGNHEGALVGFLAIVQSDRKFKDDGARKAMISLFRLLGEEHPLTREYQKQLTRALF